MQLMRALALFGVLGISLFGVGCSGSGSTTPPVLPQQNAVPLDGTQSGGTLGTMSTTAASSAVVGQVVYMTFFSSSHEFQIKTSSGAKYWIATNSGTQWAYNGLTLKLGDWVSASGSWSSSTMLAASSVSLSTTQPSTTTTTSTISTAPVSSNGVVGQVVYMTYYSTSHEFQVKTSTGALYWIAASSSTQWTYNGLTLKIGDWASATGTWKASNILGASAITLSTAAPSGASTTTSATTTSGSTTTTSTVSTPPPSGSVPKHVQTAEYLTTSTEMSTSPSVYAPYLTWAYTKGDRNGITRAAGIKTVLYTSPIMPNHSSYELNELSSSYAAARATTCAGSVITTWSGYGLLSDPTKSTTTAYFQNVVNHAIAEDEASNPGYSHPWDLIYVDNDGPLYGASATPCNYNAYTWGTAQDTALASTGQKFIVNSLSVADGDVATYVHRLSGSAVEGGEFEECFMSSLWASEEDAQLQAIALLKSQGKPGGAGFWCYADNTSALGSSSIAQRMYVYASFLLSYDPNYSVFQESFSTPSTFKVFPETGFVPLNPVTTPTGVSGLATSTGAYMREYNACYYRGSYLGKCEIVVNPSTTSYVGVPNPLGMHHSMVLSGGGVLDGGSASFGGGVPSSIGPKTGLILTP